MFDVTATEDIFSKIVDNNGIGDGSAFYNTNKQKNSYGYFYELTQGASFTVEVSVDEAADVVFILRLRSTANTTFKCSEIIKNILNNLYVGLDAEGIHQHVHDVRRDESGKSGTQHDVLHTEVQQRQQHQHRFLLVPGDIERQGKTVDIGTECIRQCIRDHDE